MGRGLKSGAAWLASATPEAVDEFLAGLSQNALLVWFGILVLISVEVGMISPPFGLNLFLINGMAKDVPMAETYKGVLGFCAMDILRLALLIAFPVVVLWLPGIK